MTTHLKLVRSSDLLDPDANARDTAPIDDNIRVPAKPSLDMLTAGSRAGEVSVQKAWEIYMAMLRSLPSEQR